MVDYRTPPEFFLRFLHAQTFPYKYMKCRLDVVVDACNPNIQKAKTGGSL